MEYKTVKEVLGDDIYALVIERFGSEDSFIDAILIECDPIAFLEREQTKRLCPFR
jgi:hypothetical protein